MSLLSKLILLYHVSFSRVRVNLLSLSVTGNENGLNLSLFSRFFFIFFSAIFIHILIFETLLK